MDDEHKIALAHARKGGIIASPDYEVKASVRAYAIFFIRI